MIDREWKPVKGYEDYAEISNYGQIHRFRREYYCGKNHQAKHIQEEDWTYGSESGEYLNACIGGTTKGVHVWVYLTFVGDIPKGLQVNHIDEDKHRNCVWNLNLMTPSQNTNWGTGNARRAASNRGRKRTEEAKKKMSDAHKNNPKISKPVQALDKDGKVIYEFPSTAEAQRQYGFSSSHISACCRGERKSHKGFIWRYAEK